MRIVLLAAVAAAAALGGLVTSAHAVGERANSRTQHRPPLASRAPVALRLPGSCSPTFTAITRCMW